uniref:Kelch repeat and BTB domain-containing protein 12 n=1 Tax=Cacopsylla melanoneura TaxID=428564 RepID=A0A8D9A1U3_9HEMI
MAAVGTEYKFRNDKGALAKLETMLNNEQRSDTLFLVNEARYRVWSHLVAAYSPVLESMINEHFAYCDDRDIKIRNVRNEESFHLLLKFMYGVEMNFTQTNIIVICEALSLAEKYEIGDFSKELKSYITSTPARFQIDTVVVLLNTARKLNLTDLYEKAKVYAYENTEQLVKHESFVDLQYEVLVDLLKSDYFCAKEIEILNGLLTWHDDMDRKKSKDKAVETTGHDTDSGFEQEGNNEHHSVASEERNLVDCYDTKSEETTSSTDDTSGLENKSEFPGETSGSNNTDNANVSSKPDSCAELVKSFKENVLKSLLSHIRIGHISALGLLSAFETELFIKYKDIVADYKLFSQSTEPRKKYVSRVSDQKKQNPPSAPIVQPDPGDLHNKFFNNKYLFTINRLTLNTTYESSLLKIGGLIFKVDLKEFSEEKSVDALFDIHLICTSEDDANWKCYTEVRVFMKPICPPNCTSCKTLTTTPVGNLYVFGDYSFRPFSFTNQVSRQYIGQLSLKLTDATVYNHFVIQNAIKMFVNFKTISITKV